MRKDYENIIPEWEEEVPTCCLQCEHWDNDWFDDYGGETWYCELYIWLPMKKRECKKQTLK